MGLTSKRQRVVVAADHGGFELKEQLVEKLRAAGHEIVDFGDCRLVVLLPHSQPTGWIGNVL